MKPTHYLNHKNIKVASFAIDDGEVCELGKIYEKERLPYLYEESDQKNIRLINSWIANRGIPFSREDYDQIMERYSVRSAKELTILGMGLNLTDHYWISGVDNEKKWEDVNYHDNDFSGRIGELMPELEEKYENFMNPDFSSNGHLKKIWIIDNNKRFLIKAGSGDLKQEPYNERIASVIAEKLGIGHVDYQLSNHEGEIFSKCPCMIDKNLEFVNSFIVFLHGNRNVDKYTNYVSICEKMGINNAREEVDKMIVLDYLVRNTDRNSGNYGILRNADTLEWVKIAPVFDNGNSLWYNSQVINNIGMGAKSECRSFAGKNEKNIELIGDVSCFDKNKLKGMDGEIKKIFKLNKSMEPERIDKIAECFNKRVNDLDMLLNTKIEKTQQRKFHR
jgi:hypothetical protein